MIPKQSSVSHSTIRNPQLHISIVIFHLRYGDTIPQCYNVTIAGTAQTYCESLYHIHIRGHMCGETNVESTEETELMNDIKNCNIGDVIHFGAFDWFVYARENNVISLLCKDSVKTGTYHSANTKMTWENCDLRKWLNGEFYGQFSSEEKALIMKTHLKTTWNLPYFTRGGNATDDFIFLLSIKEAQKIDPNMLKLDTIWWLRSPGYEQNRAADVFTNGLIDKKGCLLLHQFHAVRPAMNLDLTKMLQPG